MFKSFILLAVISFISTPTHGSLTENNLKQKNDSKSMEHIIDTYSSVFHNQDTGCYCKQNFCECCENKIGNVCIAIGYYEIFDLPAAFGINITNAGERFLSLTINATDLPCIHLPYTKNSFSVCLQIHGFNKTDKYVTVLFDLKIKLQFTSLGVPLGCLLIPRLHPHSNSDKLINYHSLLKKMEIYKASGDKNGVAFCNSPGSATAISPINVYVLLSLILVLKFSKH